MKRKYLVVAGAVIVLGAAAAWALYFAFPVQMTTYGGIGLNFLKTLSTPAGTVSTETNPAYKAPAAVASGSSPTDATWPDAAVGLVEHCGGAGAWDGDYPVGVAND